MGINAKYSIGMLLKHRHHERYILVCGLGERTSTKGLPILEDDIPVYITLQLNEGIMRKLMLGVHFVDESYTLIGTL